MTFSSDKMKMGLTVGILVKMLALVTEERSTREGASSLVKYVQKVGV